MNRLVPSVILAAALMALGLATARAQEAMTFFVTSVGPGKGADLGGIEGADRHCQVLAQAAGATAAVNARERIGRGPWHNAKGVVIAKDVEDLHATNKINKQTALSEKGEVIAGIGDRPNRHDMLTGSQPDGRAFAPGEDRTCGNWTKGGADGSAMLGHHDRVGIRDDEAMRSWNSSHPSRGCTQDGLRSTGGDGLFYCFAVN